MVLTQNFVKKTNKTRQHFWSGQKDHNVGQVGTNRSSRNGFPNE